MAMIGELRADLALSKQDCMTELDASVAMASNEQGNTALVEQRLAKLESRCKGFPQVAHNRGVLAAQADNWPEAIEHFERSLQQDSRAAMTYRHLQQIYEYRAAAAYSKALNTPVEVPFPTFELQTSALWNTDNRQLDSDRSDLHSISTIEYELFAWWQAQQNSIGIRDFYSDDFSPAAIRLARRTHANKQWQDMHREIAFTARDVVVVLSDAYHHRTLLLLRLEGNRWKIYQETNL